MSTGLTYVSITDVASNENPNGTFSYVFSSYEEAYGYGDWYCRLIQDFWASPRQLLVTIYTTGPSASGYWNCENEPPTFTSFD